MRNRVLDDELVAATLAMLDQARTGLDQRDSDFCRASYAIFLRLAVGVIGRRLVELGCRHVLRTCKVHNPPPNELFICDECGRGLRSLRRLVEVRNGLCHPELADELRMSDRDVEDFRAADEWLSRIVHSGLDPQDWPPRLSEPPLRLSEYRKQWCSGSRY